MNNNVIEFFVKMKDLMSSGLVKLATTAKQKFSDVKNHIDGIIKKNDELANSFDKVTHRAESSGSRLLSWGKRLAVGLGATAIIAGAGAFLSSSAQAAIRHEKTTKTFEVLTGNRGTGQALAGDLNKLQQDTILGPEVFKNAQTMMAFGIGAEKVVPTLKMLGDVSMGDAERLQSLTLAFSQVSATGRLMGQDLLQMVSAGFNPLNEISKMTGKSMVDLKKEMEEGKISFDMVEQAFVHATGKGGLFNNMMNKMAETTGGKIAQLEGGFEALKISVGERLKPSIDSLVGSVSKLVDQVRGWFEIPMSEKLRTENIEIQTLVGAITSLNEGNAVRSTMLNELVQKYPDLLGNIDKEKITNSELLKILQDINQAYDKRVNMAITSEELEKTKKAAKEAMDNSVLAKKAEQAFARGDVKEGNLLLREAKGQPAVSWLQGWLIKNSYKEKDAAAAYRFFQKQFETYSGQETLLNNKSKAQQNAFAIEGLYKKMQEGDASFKKEWKPEIDQLMSYVNFFNKTKGESKSVSEYLAGVDVSKYQTASSIKGSASASGTSSAASAGKEVASGITGGGPRVVNIHIGKVVEKIEIRSNTMPEALDQLEGKVEEVFLRILNSGSSMQ